jgi:ATP-dependent exoDNAse (exonuclease V) beta subunit
VKDDRAPLVDAAARERAVSDLGTSFCVEAGAGTGKTTLLVSRFLSIVERGAAPCTSIVAITFTEKAAGEMKVRLREKTRERLGDGDLSPSARANLEAAAGELERAPISTIHSFAATILREHPIEAGLDPNFVQFDALESDLFFDECWNDFLREGAESWEEAILRFTRLGGSVEALRGLADAVYARRGERACERLFDDAGVSPGPGGGDARCDGDPAGALQAPAEEEPPVLREEFARAAARLAELARDCCVDPEDRGKAAIDEFVEKMRSIGGLEGDESSYALLTLALPTGKGNKGNWRPAEACTEQKEIFKYLAALQEREGTRVSDRLGERIEGFIDGFLDFVAKRKAAQGILDFDDLLIRVRELLANDAALDALRDRYRYLLVDEFQDTDPVQAEIVWLLAGAPGDRGAGEPEPGKLFIVGDPKQSIYRFRKADIEMYERVKERLAQSGAVLSITQNFRSVPGIVAWVNETFAEVMAPEEASPFQARYEPIHPRRPGTGDPLMPVELELDGEKAKAGEIREREGEAVARLIHRLREGGITVRDAKIGVSRPLQYGDIAVIYPGTTGIDSYEDPLRAEGIPYIVEGGKLYYAREEIRDLAAAVWAIEDPYDTLSLVAALRSPMFGASDEEIFLFRRAGGRLCYLAPGAGACGAFEGLASVFALLAELHRGRNELGPSGTMLELLRRTKYVELSLLRPHGEQSVSNIRKAVSSARAFEGKIGSYRRFARWFKDQEALAAAESESSVIEEQENAVRLLTVHKAKGLQFPVVILANLVQSSRRPKQGILVERGRHIAFDFGLLRTSDYAVLAENEKRREEAEMARLLYVAATRAGDLLVIPRIPKKGIYYDLLRSHLEPGETPSLTLSELPPLRGESRPFVKFEEPAKGTKDKAAALRAAWIDARKSLLDRARRSPGFLAPSRLAAEAFERARGAPPSEPRDRPLLFGQAFHRIMELVDFSDASSPGPLASSVASELGIEDAGPELERLGAQALTSDLVARASRSPRGFREVPFVLPWEGSFIEGRIDLLFEEDGRWTLVDYKTDDVTEARVSEEMEIYRPQAAVYALALKKLGIECAGGIVLYFARPNAMMTIDYSAGFIEEAESLVRAAFIEQTSARERSRPGLP